MKKIYTIITILISIIVILTILVCRSSTAEEHNIVKYDTVIIKVPFEQIKEKIVTQQITIEKYKEDYEREKQQANSISDSAVVELFYKLASEE